MPAHQVVLWISYDKLVIRTFPGRIARGACPWGDRFARQLFKGCYRVTKNEEHHEQMPSCSQRHHVKHCKTSQRPKAKEHLAYLSSTAWSSGTAQGKTVLHWGQRKLILAEIECFDIGKATVGQLGIGYRVAR